MNKEKLRQGYTTGTCAQAATKAAMQMLFSGKRTEKIEVELPEGKKLILAIHNIVLEYDKKEDRTASGFQKLPVSASCAVKKDSGDDPDITNGVLVYSRVSYIPENEIIVDGGEGIGRITKPGLEQPVGAAAINRIPRKMIEGEIRKACEETSYPGGILAEISIPGGEELAAKTFNPRLGIEGGLSILGTSGIVEPMSEQALIDTIRVEMKVKLAEGRKYLILAPGNYGLDFLKMEYGVEESEVVKCSNYIGQTVDMAAALGCAGIVLAGHIGKLIKVSGGIMNTHSKWADCRMELLAAAALRAGLPGKTALQMLDCVTTDEALETCTGEERKKMMGKVVESIEKYLAYRAGDQMEMGAVVYSNVYGILGKTRKADELIQRSRKREEEKL